MQVDAKQIFMFRTAANGTNYEFGRVALTQEEAAKSIAADLEVVVKELYDITNAKSSLKPN